MKIKTFAPATTANLAAGFDSLGMALAPEDGSLWGDTVEVEDSSSLTLDVEGPFATRLKGDRKHNLVWIAWESFAQSLRDRGIEPQPLRITLRKNLPIASGLGSSSSSTVAALLAYNLAHGGVFSQGELLHLAAKGEGHVSGSPHYDNVAPSLLGGLQLVLQESIVGGNPCVSLPFPATWRIVVVHPNFELSTKVARSVLPTSLPLSEAVAQTQLLAGFTVALFRADEALLRACGKDLIAEPARAALVPGYDAVKRAALEAGAMVCNLSGSGPSVFALTSQTMAANVLAAMTREFSKHGLQSRGHVCNVDASGARQV